MTENVSISVNGQSKVPPGFRFHPTEEELLLYYLKKKVSNQRIDLDVIREVDLNKLEPWDIQEKCKIGTTPQNDWYFFSHKDKKYPTGTRTNRATTAGFWKATGRDKVISSNCRRIGMRKTLVFYKGRAPHGQKSDWIMHEYRLDDNTTTSTTSITNVSMIAVVGDVAEEGWVVCRIFKKKNLIQKSLSSSTIMSRANISSSFAAEFTSGSSQMLEDDHEGALEEMLQYTGSRTCKEEIINDHHLQTINTGNSNYLITGGSYNFYHDDDDEDDRLLKLPNLESPNSTGSYQPVITNNNQDDDVMVLDDHHLSSYHNVVHDVSSTSLPNWSAFDRLLASQLNGGGIHETATSHKNANFSCLVEPTLNAYTTFTDHRQLLHLHDDHELQLPSTLLRSSTSSDSSGKSYHTIASNHENTTYNNNNSETDQIDLWSRFARLQSSSPLSSSDVLCHVSNAPF